MECMDFDKWIAHGKQLGLEGAELRQCVKEQQEQAHTLAREEREREREERAKEREAAREAGEREVQLLQLKIRLSEGSRVSRSSSEHGDAGEELSFERDTWCQGLLTVLPCEANEAVARLSQQNANNYEVVKAEMFRIFGTSVWTKEEQLRQESERKRETERQQSESEARRKAMDARTRDRARKGPAYSRMHQGRVC